LRVIRWAPLLRLLAVLALGPGFAAAPIPFAVAQSQSQQRLADFARRIGLRDVPGFVATVTSLRETGHLPPAYVAKRAARAHGWHGGGLCEVWPGHEIGGDRFHNFGARLPPVRAYFEADLDETCRSRGAKRLIFAPDGPIYVTTDHYRTFMPVP
jgi:hypothetical protein